LGQKSSVDKHLLSSHQNSENAVKTPTFEANVLGSVGQNSKLTKNKKKGQIRTKNGQYSKDTLN
jgi:hypothetical protein